MGRLFKRSLEQEITKSKHKRIIDDEVVITTCLTQPRLLIEISQGHIYDMQQQWNGTNKKCALTGHVNEYPTMHYFENPRHAPPMIAYMILSFWKFQKKSNCGNVVNMPYFTYCIPV